MVLSSVSTFSFQENFPFKNEKGNYLVAYTQRRLERSLPKGKDRTEDYCELYTTSQLSSNQGRKISILILHKYLFAN